MNFLAISLSLLKDYTSAKSRQDQGHTAIVEDVQSCLAQSICSNSSDCVPRLGKNITKYASEMEFYIILATLNAGIRYLIMNCHHLSVL